MSDLCATELQRVRYWQGQTLRSRDLNDQLAIEAQRRWWHNRAVHNAFGLSLGLQTSSVLDANNVMTAVRVTCGVAYDCFGRELILRSTQEVPVPAMPPEDENAMTLLIRYKDAAQFPKRNEIASAWIGPEFSSLQAQAELVWKPSHAVEVRDGVPLARVNYSGKLPSLDPEFTPALSKPLARPCIARGATIPGNTPWKLWSIQDRTGQPIKLGFEAEIDTSAAGFTQVPCYFAWLQGPLWDQIRGEFFPAPFAHIDAASIKGFTFRLWMPHLDIPSLTRRKTTKENFDTEFLAFAQRQKLFVCWLGIQPEFIHDEKVCK
ncbi:MAG: hypothetical protein ONB48_11920 [candidate division KSB1 bacterium]|nr:hypothetical protein [candidate division KSB1 bacterium]MDZ7273978.1 hypothetical protein [candidate division KSB1 bacterium]MDZ7286351.1 hypothetical protein [candidate division KSB1 bacterium]MDZ7296579.1 hypothetical protein [candidate division KSB1 bacterium]MDZ7306112.1 hypothetical protein [candidate division KSB1 bacterium]